MAATDLTQADFDIAFAFARSEASAYVDAAGGDQVAPIDVPRFDHDPAGASRGLLLTPGTDLGTADRIAIDPLMLPAPLVDGAASGEREATVFHAFVPLGADPWIIDRRAWYTRQATAMIDGLLAQSGHHVEIGVVTGFRPNLGGFVRLRGEVWTLPAGLSGNGAGAALAVDAAGAMPIIVAGAEAP